MGYQINAAVAMAAACTTVMAAILALTQVSTGRAWKMSFGVTFAAANVTAIARAWKPRKYFVYAVVPGLLVAVFQYLWETSAAIAAVWYAGLAAETVAAIVLVA